MNYTKKSFSVASPGTREYADNWERTFRPPPPEPECNCFVPELEGAGMHSPKCNVFANEKPSEKQP